MAHMRAGSGADNGIDIQSDQATVLPKPAGVTRAAEVTVVPRSIRDDFNSRISEQLSLTMKNDRFLQPSVTIAIVIQNAEELVEQTLISAIEQDYTNKEILVVDGKSIDGTLAKVYTFSSHISCIVSEPDAGVYDGMNKAMKLASGEYIIYMNAGDTFYSQVALRQAMTVGGSKPDLIIGKYLYLFNGVPTIISPQTTAERVALLENQHFMTALQNLVCHQATITRVNYLRSMGGYDTRFQLLADQHFLLRAYDDGARHHYSTATICRYSFGGLSSNLEKSYAEFLRMLSERGYDERQLIKFFGSNLRNRIRPKLKSLALRLPIVGTGLFWWWFRVRR